MLNTVEVVATNGMALSLPLGDISNGYMVQDISGLDPVPANIVSSGFARLDGEQYQSSRREKRNIVFQIGLEPDYVTSSVMELRTNLYNFFRPKSEITLRFYVDGYSLIEIKGYVETFSAPLFTRNPVATISIICMDPDFYEPVEKVITGQSTSGTTTGIIDYDGTIETGVLLTMSIFNISARTGFNIYNQPEGEGVQNFAVVVPVQQQYNYAYSSVPGNKFITKSYLFASESILSGVTTQAQWTLLKPGRNFFRLYMTGPAESFTLRYTNKHGGL